jgi:hypothetical protein
LKDIPMPQSLDEPPRRFPVLKTIAAITFSTLLAMAVTVAPAYADEHRDRHDDHHAQERHRDDHRHGGRDYPAPPVVYSPYYAPPPVVYGPSIGIVLPGIRIGIR